MSAALLNVRETALAPRDFLERQGHVFATFDARTQDSGNVSFGVAVAGRKYFVKTAGLPEDPAPLLSHAQRIALLENAVRVAGSLKHPALPALLTVIGSAWGPMLVYEWRAGELVRVEAERRADPASSFQRFRNLPLAELQAAIGVIVDVHEALAVRGWIAGDFYDGAMLYDFAAHRLSLVDLDSYHKGPFTNEMGQMFGSSRFMAPEELEYGATIDERTTVFTLGRTLSVFLDDGTLESSAFRGTERQFAVMARACEPEPARRFASVETLAQAWRG